MDKNGPNLKIDGSETKTSSGSTKTSIIMSIFHLREKRWECMAAKMLIFDIPKK